MHVLDVKVLGCLVVHWLVIVLSFFASEILDSSLYLLFMSVREQTRNLVVDLCADLVWQPDWWQKCCLPLPSVYRLSSVAYALLPFAQCLSAYCINYRQFPIADCQLPNVYGQFPIADC